MPKTNGSNGNTTPPVAPVDSLRAAIASKRAAIASLEAAVADLQAEHDAIFAARPAVSAAAFIEHDPSKQDELKRINARLQVVIDSLDGHRYQLTTYRADLAGLEAEFDDSDRRRRLDQAEAEAADLAKKIDAGLAVAAEKWSEYLRVRDELYKVQAQRLAALDTIRDVFSEVGNLDGRPWPPREWLGMIDLRLKELIG